MSEDGAKLMSAFQNTGITPQYSPEPSFDVGYEEELSPVELVAAASVELLFEFISKYVTLGSLYSLSQPLLVLKTRIQYRTVQSAPTPRIQELDDEGNEVVQEQRPLPPISWRRIRHDEGNGALWNGLHARVLHQALWRAGSISMMEILLAFPGNNVIGILAKSVSSIMLFASLTHPLDVVSHRMMAGCAGYTNCGVYQGLVTALKEDTAYEGLNTQLLLSTLSIPVRFGYFNLPAGFLWMVGLFPLERKATLQKLCGRRDAEVAMSRLSREGAQQKRGWFRRMYGGPGFSRGFSYYCYMVGIELTIAMVSNAFADAFLQAVQELEDGN